MDFLVSIGNKPWFCVEVKSSFKDIPSSLRYFGAKLRIPFLYEVVGEENVDFLKDNIRIISASKFFSGLV